MIFATLEHILTHLSFSIISIAITIHLMTLLVHEIIGLRDSSEKGMIATFFSITGLLVTRWISSRHFPLSNLYESLIFLSCSSLIACYAPYFPRIMSGFTFLPLQLQPNCSGMTVNRLQITNKTTRRSSSSSLTTY